MAVVTPLATRRAAARVAIREATYADADAIRRVQARARKTAYRRFVPPRLVADHTVEQPGERWAMVLAAPARRERVFVAEAGERLVGFAYAGPSRDADDDNAVGELRAIYVEPGAWNRHVGRRLLATVLDFLAHEGFVEVVVWLLAENDRARRFYCRAGFCPDGAHRPDAASRSLRMIRCRRDLDRRVGRSIPMTRTAVLGLPRMGPNRELKVALEGFWAGTLDAGELQATARDIRAANWQRVRAARVDVAPCGDLSLYDHVLDTALALGAVPERFGDLDRAELDDYFALARGTAEQRPLEMTKWFGTNYHYLVPELAAGQRFELRATHWTVPLREAQALGITARPVVLGPLSFLMLSKGLEQPLSALDALVPVYTQLLEELAGAGAREVQVDEPCLVLDRTPRELDAFEEAWRTLAATPRVELCLASYFAGLEHGDALTRILALPAAEVHLDLVRAPAQLSGALAALREAPTRLSLGVLDGRNVWAADFDRALETIDAAIAALGDERITIAPSCSFLHVPYSAARDDGIDPDVRPWLAFCDEKLSELSRLATAAHADPARRDALLAADRAGADARRDSTRSHDPDVRQRLTPSHYDRGTPVTARLEAQRARVALPELPTTTIGSFPQTEEIRSARRDLRTGRLERSRYERFIEDQIAEMIRTQEHLGLDVLVHGEPERSDMVEYFAQELTGFAFTADGWVQSYGSRCVKPPILYGDVSRPAPITVRWWRHAQSLTERPVKGVLTGPVTILQWSFVRDDQPRHETCTQIALALSDEVRDLQDAGASTIQVDEPKSHASTAIHGYRRDFRH